MVKMKTQHSPLQIYLPILLLPPHTCAATLPSVPSSFHIQWYLITSYMILQTASMKSMYTYTTHHHLRICFILTLAIPLIKLLGEATYVYVSLGLRNYGALLTQADNHVIISHTNMYQPCPLLSRQIHRISRGTPPWTTDPLGLHNARLCTHHHQSQRGGPPSWGQGTQQQQDGHPQYTRERHSFRPALSNRNRFTTDYHLCLCTCTHARMHARTHTHTHTHTHTWGLTCITSESFIQCQNIPLLYTLLYSLDSSPLLLHSEMCEVPHYS